MAKQKREQESEGIRRDLETPESILREPEPQQEPDTEEQEEEEPEKLTRVQAAHRVIAEEIDGDTTLTELAAKADALYRASRPDVEADTDSAAWYVRRELETLEGIGLVDLRWECLIHPNVPKLGLPSKNGK